MLRKGSVILGSALTVLGILGFIPALTPESHLFGWFEVDGLHNLVHLASGVPGLIAGVVSVAASRLYLQAAGVFFGALALVGAFYRDADLLGIMAHNPGDVGLHLLLALIALYLGFAAPTIPKSPGRPTR